MLRAAAVRRGKRLGRCSMCAVRMAVVVTGKSYGPPPMVRMRWESMRTSRTCTRTHAHARTHTRTRTCAQAQAQVRASTRARAHENTCSHACACTDKTQWMTPCALSKRLTRTQAALGDHLSDARAAIAHRGRSIDRRPAWSAGRRRSACDAVGKQRASAHRPKDCCTQRTHGLEPTGLLPRWQC